jgi:uncharacterized iron-regulated membrane protein
MRSLATRTAVQQDWTTGRSSEIAKRVAMNANMPDMPGMNMSPQPTTTAIGVASRDPYAPIDKLIATLAPLHLAAPLLLKRPLQTGGAWTAQSVAVNRTLRTTLTLDGKTGAVLTRENFNQRKIVDRIVDTGIDAHEGQLFGWFNQLLGLFTAVGLILLSVSAVVLWWRRRAVGVLGAPVPSVQPRFSFALLALIVAFSIYLPMLGCSLILVLAAEHFVLRRIPGARRWLGLWSEVDRGAAVVG